jgi:hypothetical protein
MCNSQEELVLNCLSVGRESEGRKRKGVKIDTQRGRERRERVLMMILVNLKILILV